MIVYFRSMRTRDDEKKEALFKATVKLVNEIGFVASSVSKIAKQARVSPATLYVYYKNKEDLLVSTYIDIKLDLSQAILSDFDASLPIRDILKNVWLSMFDYVANNLEYYKFIEQFANSPYGDLVDHQAVEQYFIPIINVLERGIEQKIIKAVDRHILAAFMFPPISYLANPRLLHGPELSPADIETAFTMAWDAIKL
ncbi:MAG: TetR/AcrR family transcriptional regulator [Desulfobacterales bacterium]|nr:TetR/AcrR family transcriptional regulator [Desulfobacterales bacterium]